MPDQESSNQSELASVDKNNMAEVRTSLARSRTYMAAERTFAAWIRTGFAIAGVGVTLGTALKDTHSRWVSWVIATSLVFVGIFSFIYAWHEYKDVYDYITTLYKKRNLDTQSFYFNYFALTTITIILVVSSLLGFYLMFS